MRIKKVSTRGILGVVGVIWLRGGIRRHSR